MHPPIALLLVCGLWFTGSAAMAQHDLIAGATSVYIIAEIEVHDKERYEEYRKQVAPLIDRHNGRYLVRSGAATFGNDPAIPIASPEGNWLPDRIIVIEFPSRTHLERFVADPAYKTVASIRQAAATTRTIVVDGLEP
jgi:uncharacterized protein (DUF1330 family)